MSLEFLGDVDHILTSKEIYDNMIFGYRQPPVLERELSKHLFRPSGGKSLPYLSMTIRTLHLGPVQCMRCMPPLNNVTRNPNHGSNLLLLLIYMASLQPLCLSLIAWRIRLLYLLSYFLDLIILKC